jgi:hypothetical protein
MRLKLISTILVGLLLSRGANAERSPLRAMASRNDTDFVFDLMNLSF